MSVNSDEIRRRAFENSISEIVRREWLEPTFGDEDFKAQEMLYPVEGLPEFEQAAGQQWRSLRSAGRMDPRTTHRSSGKTIEGGWQLTLESAWDDKKATTDVIYHADGRRPSTVSRWENVGKPAKILNECLKYDANTKKTLSGSKWTVASEHILIKLNKLGYSDPARGLYDPASGSLVVGTAKWEHNSSPPSSQTSQQKPIILEFAVKRSSKSTSTERSGTSVRWKYSDGKLESLDSE